MPKRNSLTKRKYSQVAFRSQFWRHRKIFTQFKIISPCYFIIPDCPEAARNKKSETSFIHLCRGFPLFSLEYSITYMHSKSVFRTIFAREFTYEMVWNFLKRWLINEFSILGNRLVGGGFEFIMYGILEGKVFEIFHSGNFSEQAVRIRDSSSCLLPTFK